MEAIVALIGAHEQGLDNMTIKTVHLCPECQSKVSGRQMRYNYCKCGYNDRSEERKGAPQWLRGYEISMKIVGVGGGMP